jgi:diguanylate cyclase (GGDEF)-like protein/putative nucleotidyltransferase with HDIG domain
VRPLKYEAKLLTTSLEATLARYQAAFNTPSKRPLRIRIIVGSMVLLGLAALLATFGGSITKDLYRFLSYMSLAALASGVNVRLPHTKSSISINTLFVLMGIVDLTVPQAVILAAVAAVVEQLWTTRSDTDAAELLFHASATTLAAFVSTEFLHSAWFRHSAIEPSVTFALATCLYFVMNSVPGAIYGAQLTHKPIYSVWWRCYSWSFPYHLLAGTLIVVSHAIANIFTWQTAALLLPVLYVMFRAYKLNVNQLESDKKYAEQMAGLHLRTIEALALAIEAKDHVTNDHLHRVQMYAQEIGKEMGLHEDQLRALQAASLLHDIGKLAVPEHIISKPGRLTPEEFEKMKIHPLVGAEILECVQFPYPVVPIVAAHHERWDGSGYPEGLSGEQIPVGARILAAVDCLDALASDRQYRRALPLEEAMRLVKEQAGSAFDPRVVAVLEARYVELEQMARANRSGKTRLSTNIRIANGAAPAAGFAEHSALPEPVHNRRKGDFLSSIAAARHEVHMLFEMSQALGTSLSLVDTLSVLAKRLQAVVPHDTFAIFLQRDGKLHPEYVTGIDASVFSSLSIPVGEGLSGWVAENAKPVLNGNPGVEPGYLTEVNTFTTLRSALSVPLESVSGTIGVLTLYANEKEAFTQDHVRILLAISSKLALSIENSLRFRQAEDNATVDFLTGLPNGRSLFVHVEQEVTRCKQDGRALAVLVCDLDGFKNVNDTFGHLEGNRILRKAASIFKRNSRPSDYVARMGGDEFVIVMPEIRAADLPPIIERMRMAIQQASIEDYGEPLLNVSIGFAELTQEICQAEQLLSEADREMYKVKRKHKQEEAECKPFTSPSLQTSYMVQ